MAEWPDNPQPPTGDLPALESPEPPQHADTSKLDLSRLGLPPRPRSRFEPPADTDSEGADPAEPEGSDESPSTEPAAGDPTDRDESAASDWTETVDGSDIETVGEADAETFPAPVYPPHFPDQFPARFPPADLPPEPPVRAPLTPLGAVRVASRALVGTVGIGVAVAAIAAASWLPLPRHSQTPPSMLVTPAAATQQRVCAGPVLQPAAALDAGAGAISSIGQPKVAAASAAGAVAQEALDGPGDVGTPPTMLTLPAAGAALAGSQSQQVSGDRMAGLATAECAEAGGETWLVGGATDTGRTTLLTLSNPGAVPATVSVAVFTENGEIAAAGSDGIIVAAGGRRILPLAGFAPDARSPVVRVTSVGGHVVANLQHSIVRTLAPGGVAIVGAAAKPAKHVLIPGVVVSQTEAIAARQNNEGFADLAPVLRVYVPGTTASALGISIVREDGSPAGEPVSITVPGGVVTDVPLEVDDGSFVIGISSSTPIVAAARVSTVGKSGAIDLSWFSTAPQLRKSAEIAVAPGPDARLHLANPTDSDVVATITGAGRKDASVPVPAHAAVVVAVAPGAYRVAGFDRLAIAVSYLGDGQVGGFTVSPAAPTAAPIRVYP